MINKHLVKENRQRAISNLGIRALARFDMGGTIDRHMGRDPCSGNIWWQIAQDVAKLNALKEFYSTDIWDTSAYDRYIQQDNCLLYADFNQFSIVQISTKAIMWGNSP